MMNIKNNSGFSAVELLITLFVIVAFFVSGYQLYNTISTYSGDARMQARANNVAMDYINRYKPDGTSACSAQTIKNNESITVTGLSNVTITITISCPSNSKVNVAEITSTLSYGNPAKTVSNVAYIQTQPIACPTGFIKVPGSETYKTDDFCVMKYEAKADDNGDGVGDTTQTTGKNTWPANTHPISATRKIVSTPAGYPIANIDQEDTISAALSYTKDCNGCHLITEAEWLTIAQNVMMVPSNWSGGAVGSGYIYSGHNDSAPDNAIEATATDSDGYYNTGNVATSNQRRTLTLSNGEVIWDFAGNLREWTSGTTFNSQPGTSGEIVFAWKNWNAINVAGSLEVNANPSFACSCASTWTAETNGIGKLFTNVGEINVKRAIIRSGYWGYGSLAGIFTFTPNYDTCTISDKIGFRVAR